MSKNENLCAKLLAGCGFNQSELAKRISVHPNTVSKWANGARMPGSVIAYLKLYADVRVLLND